MLQFDKNKQDVLTPTIAYQTFISQSKPSMESLKSLLRETLTGEIFCDKNRPKNGGKFEWAVLIVDKTTTSILQSCMQVQDILAQNIACIEMMENEAKPPIDLHAIYFLSPVSKPDLFNKVVQCKDIEPKNKY